jgi:hypothetical protein
MTKPWLILLTLCALSLAARKVIIEHDDGTQEVFLPAPATQPTPPAPTSRPTTFGLNLDANVDWSGLGWSVDAMRTFRPWSADGKTNSYMRGYPGGVYRCLWRGDAKLQWGGRAWKQTPPIRDGEYWRVDVTIAQADGIATLAVTGAIPTELHLFQPGEDWGTVCTSQFKRFVQPFTTLRFMDWAGTNRVGTWAQRRLPNEVIQATYNDKPQRGVAWELMVLVCNETGKDAWVNVPDTYDDGEVVELAKIWRGLEPGRICYVAHSNEVWNGSFDQNPRLVARAKAGNISLAALHAERTVRIGEIFREQLGDRVRPVLEVWASQPAFAEDALKAIPPPANAKIWAIAPALYVSTLDSFEQAAPSTQPVARTADQFASELTRRASESWNVNARHVALARQYELPGRVLIYEGGQHQVVNLYNGIFKRATNVAGKQGVNDSPLIAGFQHAWAGMARREFPDGALVMHYCTAGPDWGLAHHVLDVTNPKYVATTQEAAAN